jgi:ribosomal protein S18 acetylase RimI-like enzyme
MPLSIVYRNLRWSDYVSAKGLFQTAFAFGEWKNFAEIWRARCKIVCFSAWYKDLLVGFTLVDSDNNIKYIAVHPDYQGYKIGSVLLTKVIESLSVARSIRLTTAADRRLVTWYGSYGFKPDHIYTNTNGVFLGASMVRRQRCRSGD